MYHAICYPAVQLQFRKAVRADMDSPDRRPSKRRHERDHGSCSRGRSPSPRRTESSRKRHRSRSPRGSPPDRPEKRPRGTPARSRREKTEFFQAGAAPRGGVCAICLGRHEHVFARCDTPKLWDGTVAAARKNEDGRLVATDGFPLCFDWQVPRGCASTSHPDRHKCSGCGKPGHGAQACPLAEKA